MHMRGRNPWSVARASQSQVQAGVSLAIQNCMRNQARPVGGSVWKISELDTDLMHGLSDKGKAMTASSKSG